MKVDAAPKLDGVGDDAHGGGMDGAPPSAALRTVRPGGAEVGLLGDSVCSLATWDDPPRVICPWRSRRTHLKIWATPTIRRRQQQVVRTSRHHRRSAAIKGFDTRLHGPLPSARIRQKPFGNKYTADAMMGDIWHEIGAQPGSDR
jgi:hypothetical protein